MRVGGLKNQVAAVWACLGQGGGEVPARPPGSVQ